MKLQHRHFAKSLLTRTFIPCLSESMFWAFLVFDVGEDTTLFALQVFNAKGAKHEFHASTTSYSCNTFASTMPPVFERCDDDVLGDGVLALVLCILE